MKRGGTLLRGRFSISPSTVCAQPVDKVDGTWKSLPGCKRNQFSQPRSHRRLGRIGAHELASLPLALVLPFEAPCERKYTNSMRSQVTGLKQRKHPKLTLLLIGGNALYEAVAFALVDRTQACSILSRDISAAHA